MGIPQRAIELERAVVETGSALGLAEAFELMRDRWRAGDRDRELGLHLMFLAYYLRAEPSWLTGYDEKRVPWAELAAIFIEIHDHFAPVIAADLELLFVLGWMAYLGGPLPLAAIQAKGLEYRRVFRRLVPQGGLPELFHDRGFYGSYFARFLRPPDGLPR